MPMRLSGLMSGMDTESIVSQLVEARKTKVTKAVKAQKSLKFKQDAWKDLNKKIVNLYNKSLTNMRFQSSYIKKITKVSNSNVVSVITGEKAMNSVQSLKVTELAKTGFLTGGRLKLEKDTDGNPAASDATVTGSTKLSQLGFTSDTGNLEVRINGEVSYLDVNGDSTVEQFVSALRTVGLNANFDEVNQRLYVASKSSGVKNDFSITAVDGGGFEALEKLKLSYGYDDPDLKRKYQSIYDSFYDPNKSVVNDRLESRRDSLNTYWTSIKNNRGGILAGFSEDAIEEVNNQLSAAGAGFTLEVDNSDETPKIVKNVGGAKTDIAEDDYAGWDAIDSAVKKAQEKFQADYENGTDEDVKNAAFALAESFNGWIKNQNELITVENNFVGSSSVAGGGVQLDGGKPKLSQTVIDSVTAEVKKEADDAKAVLNRLNYFDKKLADIEADTSLDAAGKAAARKAVNDEKAAMGQKTQGQDAQIYLNDVLYTSDKNTFEVNGITLTVSAKTAPDEEVTITTEDDTNGIYDMIKNFFKEYNSIINEMDKLYNAESSKGYDPLTDEEKEAMSDSQIEEWETKIKDSILRKDSTLSTFSQAMKTIMLEGVEVNGKQMYLSNFGINTLNYFLAGENEKNAYHIDGDPDDENTSGNADKLKSMIANDPDTVVSFFTQLSQKLSDKMFDLMKSREGFSSAMTVYDDKKMQTDYDDYTSKIKELEKKLADYEDKWYAKFAAMETAMAKMQNNASAVTSLLGG